MIKLLTFVFVPLVQTPTAGQRWRSLSSPSPGRGTPSSPWRQLVTAVSQRTLKTRVRTQALSAGLCWCSEAETTRASSTPTWRLSPWRNCLLLFKESRRWILTAGLDVEPFQHPHRLVIIYIPVICHCFLSLVPALFFLLWLLNGFRSSGIGKCASSWDSSVCVHPCG